MKSITIISSISTILSYSSLLVIVPMAPLHRFSSKRKFSARNPFNWNLRYVFQEIKHFISSSNSLTSEKNAQPASSPQWIFISLLTPHSHASLLLLPLPSLISPLKRCKAHFCQSILFLLWFHLFPFLHCHIRIHGFDGNTRNVRL